MSYLNCLTRENKLKELQRVMKYLHNHSDYSNIRLLDSTNKIKNMILKTSELGSLGFALTDHECLSGHVKYLNLVNELKEENKIPEEFKPVLGNEIYLVDENNMREEITSKGSTKFYHFLLLAKDKIGHRQLRELSSRAWDRMFNYKGLDRVPTYYVDMEEVIGEDRGHIIASTACLGSYFSHLVLKLETTEDEEEQLDIKYEIDDFIQWCIELFGRDNFFIELQPSNNEDQVMYNKKAVIIAEAYNLKYIVTTDSHYLQKKDRYIHEAYLNSNEDEGGGRELADFYSTTYFMPVEEIFEYMSYFDDTIIENAIINTNYIVENIENYSLKQKQEIPKTPIPNEEEWYKDEELYSLALEYEYINELNQLDKYGKRLINLALEGFKDKIKKEDYKESFKRMDLECKEIIGISKAKDEPASAYFTTMVNNINIIWEEAKCIIPPGRGSAGGFIINYLIGITQVNPLKQGIEMPHFRFISAERPDWPDIDIDISSHKRNKAFNCLRNYYQSFGGDLVRVCTFGTETSKSAIQTACRGLKINNDIGLLLSSLIPVERGFVWSLSDCYYGNMDKHREAITEFKNIVDSYIDKDLLSIALGIEGLINKRSSHACGCVPTNHKITYNNAIMRTPSGELVTQYDLGDTETMGLIKYDFLNTQTSAMIQLTLEMLIKEGHVKWEGSLRKTYDKVLHPDVLMDIKDDENLWKLLTDGKLISAFQFDSGVGEQAIKLIQPTKFIEAMSANNLMRLMAEEGKESPMITYKKNKQDINLWYKEMRDFGLNEKEISILEKHLLDDYGVCSDQETMMLMTMDEDIANFGVVESNIVRKGVAKKIGAVYEKAHKLFYEWGLKLGSSKKLLDYVWDVQIAKQKGYGFSKIHGVEYTWILVQQLALISKFNPIYWNTAVLLLESGAIDDSEIEEDDKTKEKGTKYGEVATAISKLQDKGVVVSLPDINKAELGFTPFESENEIMFGLKGLLKINNETSRMIIENRPYKSLQDFHNRMVEVKREVTLSTGKKQMKSLVSSTQTIILIKAGAFDRLENKPREEILEDYLKLLYPFKKEINASNFDNLIELGIVPDDYKIYIRYRNFKTFLETLPKVVEETEKIVKKTGAIKVSKETWIKIDCEDGETTDYTLNFINEHFIEHMKENVGYKYNEEGVMLIAYNTKKQGTILNVYESYMNEFKKWVNSKECLDLYNKLNFNEVKSKYMLGNISSWEMESMSIYYSGHELKNIDTEKYGVVDFNSLPEDPTVIGYTTVRNSDVKYPKFELVRIMGTVLDRDRNKHLVTLLTPTGVVNVKFYSGQFSFYDKTISENTSEGKKVVLEDGWFKRGNKLLVTGFRRGDQFKPKKYSNSIYKHTVQMIERIEGDNLILRSERVRVND